MGPASSPTRSTRSPRPSTLLHFDCDAETLDELTRVLKITDGALRHMAVRRLPAAATMPARAVRPAREHREAPRPRPRAETVQAAE